MEGKEIDINEVIPIIDRHKDRIWSLIPLLQEIQDHYGYIPPESLEMVASALKIFPSQVQGVTTFYSGFTLTPKGKYVLRVCRGTACHVKGGRAILRIMKRELDLEEGETSPDYQFTLETVACLGACFLAPAMMVNRTYFGKLTSPKVTSVLSQYQKDEGDN